MSPSLPCGITNRQTNEIAKGIQLKILLKQTGGKKAENSTFALLSELISGSNSTENSLYFIYLICLLIPTTAHTSTPQIDVII